ncbi:hypothetical protein RBB50_009458 [Rhinocladiella similis]
MACSFLWLIYLITSSGIAVGVEALKSSTAVACSAIPAPVVLGAKVISIAAAERYNTSITNARTGFATPAGLEEVTSVEGINVCDVNVSLTHPGDNDMVNINIWLPLEGWNGRFQGVGGGGWLAGYPGGRALAYPVSQGWAAATTDGGNISANGAVLNPNALTSSGDVNWGLLVDFSSRALHETAVVGKAVAQSFYGKAPRTYFNGCSTGGRQGYMLAQKYPLDYDGILANGPALYWPTFTLTMNWAHFLMNSLKTYPSPCEYSAFQNASIAACDALDGVSDGIISDVAACNFDPYSLVGTTAKCGEEEYTITSAAATVVAKIREGPKTPWGTQLWDGMDWGMIYSSMAPTKFVNGTWVNQPDAILDSWVQYFILQDPGFDFETTTLEQLTDFYALAPALYDGVIGTSNSDLSQFRDAGRKLLTWHGMNDERIMINNTIKYRLQVEGTMGGKERVNEFYRLFFPPGVGHCGGGRGPVPRGGLDALVAWVEEGTAPDVLFGEAPSPLTGANMTRNICLWPKVARFNGGDPLVASSFSCADSF